MITVTKGISENPETFRLIMTCDQCQAHVATDVPVHIIQDLGEAATLPYLERARIELAKTCPHMQEELQQHAKEALPSQQDTWNTPQIRSSYTDESEPYPVKSGKDEA